MPRAGCRPPPPGRVTLVGYLTGFQRTPRPVALAGRWEQTGNGAGAVAPVGLVVRLVAGTTVSATNLMVVGLGRARVPVHRDRPPAPPWWPTPLLLLSGRW